MSGSTETARALWNALPDFAKNIIVGIITILSLFLIIFLGNILLSFAVIRTIVGTLVFGGFGIIILYAIGAFLREFIWEDE